PRRVRGEAVWASGTLNGNPLAAAAGLAALKTLQQPGTYEELERVGHALFNRFSEIAAASDLPLQTLGDPVIVRLTFGGGGRLDQTTQQRGDVALRNQLEIELFERGVFANVAAKFYLSIRHEDADVENAAVALEHALGALERRDGNV